MFILEIEGSTIAYIDFFFHFAHFSQRCILLFKYNEVSINHKNQRNCKLRLIRSSLLLLCLIIAGLPTSS